MQVRGRCEGDAAIAEMQPLCFILDALYFAEMQPSRYGRHRGRAVAFAAAGQWKGGGSYCVVQSRVLHSIQHGRPVEGGGAVLRALVEDGVGVEDLALGPL